MQEDVLPYLFDDGHRSESESYHVARASLFVFLSALLLRKAGCCHGIGLCRPSGTRPPASEWAVREFNPARSSFQGRGRKDPKNPKP